MEMIPCKTPGTGTNDPFGYLKLEAPVIRPNVFCHQLNLSFLGRGFDSKDWQNLLLLKLCRVVSEISAREKISWCELRGTWVFVVAASADCLQAFIGLGPV